MGWIGFCILVLIVVISVGGSSSYVTSRSCQHSLLQRKVVFPQSISRINARRHYRDPNESASVMDKPFFGAHFRVSLNAAAFIAPLMVSQGCLAAAEDTLRLLHGYQSHTPDIVVNIVLVASAFIFNFKLFQWLATW